MHSVKYAISLTNNKVKCQDLIDNNNGNKRRNLMRNKILNSEVHLPLHKYLKIEERKQPLPLLTLIISQEIFCVYFIIILISGLRLR